MHLHPSNLTHSPLDLSAMAIIGVISGLVGGLAEVLWIWLYSSIVGDDPLAIAAAVSATFVTLGGPIAVVLGLAVHMVLAAALGLSLTAALRLASPRLARSASEVFLVVIALVAVWGANFFVLLPIINPGFVHIVPLPVSLISKLSFGIAAAYVLHRRVWRSGLSAS